MKVFVVLLLCAGLLLGGVALAAEEVIRIGANLEMTGAVAAYGQMIWEGINLIREIVGDAVAGKKVELVLVDNKSDPVEAANATTRLIDKEGVVAIIGPAITKNMLAAAPICEEKQIPIISATATNPLVTQGRKFVFRACFTDPYQGAAAAKFAFEDLKAKTAAILSDIAQDYCVALGNYFKEAFEKQGGKVVVEQHCKTGDQDFSAQLTTIINANPDLIYVPNYYTEIALICRQARDLGYEGIILSADGADAPELFDVGGDAVEGLYHTAAWDATKGLTEIGQKYIDLYRQKFGKDPNMFGALGADAYLILLNAIERAGSIDSAKIRDAMEDTKDLDVVTGRVTIENGDPIKPVVVRKVENKRFVVVKALAVE
ncbi:MAG: ABC transporter substrate-binding protein [Candidatus Caldatribacterium sp.]|nr:ABC transporter substrate-binding protein [Candidatus Caldatribacterium sp.]